MAYVARFVIVALFALFGFSAVRAAGDDIGLDEARMALQHGDNVTLRGYLYHDDGDWFIYRCGGSLCVDTIERDGFMQSHLEVLDRTMATVVVKRELCSKQLSYACLHANGSFLHVIEWITPISSGEHP